MPQDDYISPELRKDMEAALTQWLVHLHEKGVRFCVTQHTAAGDSSSDLAPEQVMEFVRDPQAWFEKHK